jgi:hypothetical protein
MRNILLFFVALFMLNACSPGQLLPVAEVQEQTYYYLPAVSRADVPTFTFISWADTKDGKATLRALSAQSKVFHPLFTMFPGDLEADGFTSTGMAQWMAAMDGGTGNGMAGITFPMRGNHDFDDPAGWQAYFHLSDQASGLKLANFTSLDDDLTYSFDYSNAHFLAVDVPGNAELITQRQLNFIDQDLGAAEGRGLLHAFLFFHGPVYLVSSHTSCETRVCATPPEIAALIAVLNRHPIVSATFHGHEHLLAYVHMDKTRVPEITRPFEEFISGSAGAEMYPCNKTYRFDACDSGPGFSVVRVQGHRFTVGLYRLGQAAALRQFSFVKKNFTP